MLLNTRTGFYWRILGHSSFVSDTLLTRTRGGSRLRVTASSFDGSLSVSDFEEKDVNNENVPDRYFEDGYLPIREKFDSKYVRNVQLQHR